MNKKETETERDKVTKTTNKRLEREQKTDRQTDK